MTNHLVNNYMHIRPLRNALNLTQLDVAKKASCSKQYIGNLERGEKDLQRADKRIRKVFDIMYRTVYETPRRNPLYRLWKWGLVIIIGYLLGMLF